MIRDEGSGFRVGVCRMRSERGTVGHTKNRVKVMVMVWGAPSPKKSKCNVDVYIVANFWSG